MDIQNSFDVELPLDQAWMTLLDIQKIAPCMPGAELLEVIDDKTYKGKVSVRLGPVVLAFVGTARLEEIDKSAHRARVRGQGTDSKGRGGANGVVTFALSATPGGTKVDVSTTLNLSGTVAQYGRGSGIIQDVAAQIVGQFATALNNMLRRENSSTEAPQDQPRVNAPPSQSKPISGFRLLAKVLLNAFRRLFPPA